MLDIINKASDEKYNQINIQTYKYFAKQVSYLTAKYGVKYWDKAKDVLTISELIKYLDKQLYYIPENKQLKASSIFNNFLEIKQIEEEGEKTEENAKYIKKLIDSTMKMIDEL